MSSSSTVEGEGSSSSPPESSKEVEARIEVAEMELDVEEADPEVVTEAGGEVEGEDEDEDAQSYHSSDSYSSDEIEAMLDEGLPDDYRRAVKPREFTVKEITVLEEKGRNNHEVLPTGWIEVRHCSGMPIYLHRKTRVCSLTKPYNLGPGSARRHQVPLSAIPCLAYTKALEREKQQREAAELPEEPLLEVIPSSSTSKAGENIQGRVCPLSITNGGAEIPHSTALIPSKRMRFDSSVGVGTPAKKLLLPRAKVETAIENNTLNSIEPIALRDYCKKLFKFKNVTCKRFRSWSARRKHNKQQKRIQLQRPTLPEGVKLITFPIYNSGEGDGGRPGKEYVMNPLGKSSVCILHEYVQHALRLQPKYEFKEIDSATTPYSATVLINGLLYGTGIGSSKKQAKAEAAKQTLEILIPAMKDQLDGPNAKKNEEIDRTVYFDQMQLDDPRIAGMCQNMSEPSPYTLLLTCLQRNFGQDEKSNIHFQMLSSNNQSNKFCMKVKDFSVDVTATNKKEGKQLASQAILALIHPHIKNFGSFLRLYGNGSIKTVKEKKQEEQQITTLQSKASANSPNYAILAKLREEMRKLVAQPPVSSTVAETEPPPMPTSTSTELIPFCEALLVSSDSDATVPELKGNFEDPD